MSYSRRYSAQVHYSGSVRYSYPASEHGGSGSAYYSGSVPVRVTINVNTSPFDGSVNNCNASIDHLTGSVVAMNAAQVAAIRNTALAVSQSLIDGFYGAIQTEISQQLSALDSGIKAGLGLIVQQGEAMAAQKSAMETDYNRVSSRYVNLFTDLDDECRKRVQALDKPAFDLAENVQRGLLQEARNNSVALNVVAMEEESFSRLLLLVSAMNRKTQEVLRSLEDYISQDARFTDLVDSFLLNQQADGDIYLPVLLAESDALEGSGAVRVNFVPDFVAEDRQGQIAAGCAGQEPPAMTREEKDALSKEFSALAEGSFGEADGQRVYETMLSLWRKSEFVN